MSSDPVSTNSLEHGVSRTGATSSGTASALAVGYDTNTPVFDDAGTVAELVARCCLRRQLGEAHRVGASDTTCSIG